MTALTERDKKLLYILGVMVVLALAVYLLLLPAVRSYSEMSAQVALAAQQVDERQAMINTIDQVNAEVQQLRRQITQKSIGYPAIMHNLQLDRGYTQRAVLGRWQPTELTLDERVMFEMVPFGGVPPVEGETDEDTAETTETTEAANKLGMLPSQLVSMKAIARQSDILSLMQLYAESRHEKLVTLVIRDDLAELEVDTAGNAIVNTDSDNPMLSVEVTIRQIFAVEQAAVRQGSGVSFE